jgi:E3 Ubiquitin ligase
LFPARLITSFASGAGGLVVVSVGGAIAGLYLFFKGFNLLRFKRLILNTPLSRIHSASIGLVEVTGTPVGPHVLKAPVTGDPCYYYNVRAFQWVETSNNKHQWKRVLDETLFVPFFLEDTTGRVLVDPQGAQMDVHPSFKDEIDTSIFNMPGMCPPNVRDFLARRGLVPAEKIRLEERIIPQGFPLFVFGTLGENPAFNGAFARPQSKSFSTSLSVSLGALSSLPASSAPVSAAARATFSTPSTDNSNFGPFDPHPSAAISTGQRGEPFAISGHSQKELVGKLAWQSTACIWGGPLLAIACLYFLMVYAQ